jgi:hypothetical protein
MGAEPVPDATLGRETRRSGCGDRRAVHGRHPRQRLLRYEIRAGPRVGDDRRSEIGSAIAAEVAAVADLGPELLRCVGSAARIAECHRVVWTQREKQRSESDEQQHDAASSSSKRTPVKPGGKIVRWEMWILVDNPDRRALLLRLLPRIALSPFARTYPPPADTLDRYPRVSLVLRSGRLMSPKLPSCF